VSRVDPHTPASTSGVRVGDHVVRVNGCDVTAASLLDVASLVRCVALTTAAACTVLLLLVSERDNDNCIVYDLIRLQPYLSIIFLVDARSKRLENESHS